jgi:two-component system LytT family response regulator
MKTCKVLIADDENLARKAIKLQLQEIPDLQIVAECNNGHETLLKISSLLPDIIFLDIKMPLLTGFEVLEKLPADYYPYIIIVTAFDNFALQAYDHDAVDYLLKPFSNARFRKAFDKSYLQWQRSNEHAHRQPIAQRMANAVINPDEIIRVKDGTQTSIVPFHSILYIEAAKDYVCIYTADRKYLYKETMQTMEQGLSSHGFARIHRSHIVNTNSVRKLISLYNGDHIVELQNGHKLRLSRNYRANMSPFL